MGDGPKHPTWDGAVTREESDLNRKAAGAMQAFYLGRGFMETPMWEELGDDERYGWRSVVAARDRGEW